MAWRSVGDLAVKVLRRLEKKTGLRTTRPKLADVREVQTVSGKGGAVCIGPRTAQTGENMSSRRENTQTCRLELCGGTVATAPPVLCCRRVYYGVVQRGLGSAIVGTMPTQMTMVVVICVDVVHG